MRLTSVLLVAFTLVVGTAEAAGERPRVGLVLSGGGARGAAHVGVLKVLEAERIPIDAVAGTSMGAVVGGLYASGLSAAEIAAFVESPEWRQAFQEPGPRDRLSFRRKSEDQNFLVDFPVGLKSGTFRIPKGLVSGQRLSQALRRITLPVARIQQFDALPSRFRAVATDLETGEAIDLAQGDLVSAMRASLAAPGVFAPVEIDGRLLVDGGLANNLPVELARRMDVDVLIVVDVGFPLRKRDTLDSVATISNQMLSILIRRGSDAQRQMLRPTDILLAPELGEASSFDFDIVPKAVELGEASARAALERLAALRLGESDYSRFLAERRAVRGGAPRVEEVRVAADSVRYERVLRAGFVDLSSAEGLDAGLTTLFGRGNFESVDYRLRDGARGDLLELSARRNSWGPNYVRFGLNLEDDFNGNSTYNAAARIVLADIGSLAAEWVWDFQIGSEPKVATEFYIPFGDSARWFVMPQASFDLRNVPLIEEGVRRAEYRLRTTEYGIDVGRSFPIGARSVREFGVSPGRHVSLSARRVYRRSKISTCASSMGSSPTMCSTIVIFRVVASTLSRSGGRRRRAWAPIAELISSPLIGSLRARVAGIRACCGHPSGPISTPTPTRSDRCSQWVVFSISRDWRPIL